MSLLLGMIVLKLASYSIKPIVLREE